MKKRNQINLLMTAAITALLIFPLIGCAQNSSDKDPADRTGQISAASDSLYMGNKDSSQSNTGNSGMMGRGMMNGGGMRKGMMSGGMMMNGGTAGAVPSGTWEAPSSADSINNPLAGIVEATKKGENIFNQYCVPCHGSGGQGNGPTAATLNQKPANLTSERVQAQSDGDIFWKMSTGRGTMAAYKNILSKNQRWELVDYIRLLGNKS